MYWDVFYRFCWIFVIYSFLGWCVEVCFNSVLTGKFVNRGFLNGATCPIYGFGMCIVIAGLLPMSDNIIILFLGSVILTSALELVAGFILKKLFNISWWDYSDNKFNLGGYICLKFSLAWGVGGVLAVKLIHPLVQGLINAVPMKIGIALLCFTLVCLLCDAIATISAIAKLNRDLGSIAQIANMLHKTSEVLAQNIGNEAIAASEYIEEGMDIIDEKKASVYARIDLARAEFADTKDFMRRRLLKAFPSMKNLQYQEALAVLRKWYDDKTKK